MLFSEFPAEDMDTAEGELISQDDSKGQWNLLFNNSIQIDLFKIWYLSVAG